MNSKQGLVVSVVSGKGGVGKTMLAVAVARELSTSVPTLILDLDFFNRGLTGLMRHGRVLQQISPPEFFASSSSDQPQQGVWELVEVAPNLIHVRYPDFAPEQIQVLENTDITQLRQALWRFLDDLKKVAACEAIVVDCHGGPDQLSFAACTISDYSLLVSEPDKITFYGTLHFLRQLRRVIPKDLELNALDVRLVFNKVVPAFSAVYLRRFYDKEVRRRFDDRPLLAVFPMEMYLTKEFERTPFLTAVFPFSLLAKKTRVLLRDLLLEHHANCVPRSIRGTLRIRLSLLRNSIGRTPWIADLNKVMAVIAIVGVLIFAVEYYGQSVSRGASSYLVVQALRTLETIQYAQTHSGAIPQECASRQLWQERLSCWQSHKHQDPGGQPIFDYYGNEEIRKISADTDTARLQTRRKALLGNAELRSNPDVLIQDSYKKLQAFSAPSWFGGFILPFYDMAEKATEALSITAVVWFLIALLLLWSGELDQTFTYLARVGHHTRAFLTLLLSAALWFPPLLLLAAGIRESARTARIANALSSTKYLVTNKALQILVAAALIVLVGVLFQQWYKAFQDLRYEKQRFEGFARVVFGFYTITMLALFLTLLR